LGKLSDQKREFFAYLLWRIASLPVPFDKKSQLQETYDQKLNKSKEALWSFSRNADLRNGLCFASHSFLERIDQYYEKRSPERKKIRQTEDQLALWRNRMCLQAAPFSTFGRVALSGFPKGGPISPVQERSFFYHYTILNGFLKEKKRLEDASGNPILLLNPSIWESKEHLRFIWLDEGEEHFQELEVSPVVDWLLKMFKEENPIPQLKLAGSLAEMSESTEEEVMAYLKQLERTGLLIHLSKIPIAQNDWPGFFLNEFGQNDQSTRIESVLEALDELPVQLSGSKPVEKVEKLGNVFSQLKEQGISGGFSKERILYENSVSNDLFLEEPAQWLPCLEQLSGFADFLYQHYSDPLTSRVVALSKAVIKEKGPMSLIEFYAKWVKLQKHFPYSRQAFQFRKEMFRFEEGRAELDLQLIKTGSRERKSSNPYQPRSIAAAVAPFYGENRAPELKLISYSIGCGRLWGRYREFYPDALTRIGTRNKELYDDGKACVVSDHSTYLAFDQAGLLPYEITLPGAFSKYSRAQQIQLKDLWLVWDKEIDAAVLIDRQDEKPVFPLDLSLESRATRSPLYRFLCLFGGTPPFLGGFLQDLTSFFQRNHPKNSPKVYWGEGVLLKPARRFFRKEGIPQRGNREEQEKYFHRIDQWRNKNVINRFGWWRNKIERPLFVDFEDPVLVRCLSTWIKKAGEELWFDEIAPAPGQFLKSEGKERYVEWVVEMDI
jgi:hypothetical protein